MQREIFFKLANKPLTEFINQTLGIDIALYLNEVDLQGIAFLHHVVKNNNVKLMTYIVENFSNTNFEQLTPSPENLLYAVQSIEMFHLLMKTSLKDKIFDKDIKENTLLHKYISNLELLKEIKPFFPDINIKNKLSQPPLYFLKSNVQIDNFIAVYKLYDYKAELNFMNKKDTLFLFSLYEVIKYKDFSKLLELNIDFSQKDINGNSLIHFMAKSSDLCHKLSMLRNETSLTSIINDKNNMGQTAFSMFLEKNNTSGLEKLIALGLEPTPNEVKNWLNFEQFDNQYKHLWMNIFLNYFLKSNKVFDKIIQSGAIEEIEKLRADLIKNSAMNLKKVALDKMKLFDVYYEKQNLEKVIKVENKSTRKMKI